MGTKSKPCPQQQHTASSNYAKTNEVLSLGSVVGSLHSIMIVMWYGCLIMLLGIFAIAIWQSGLLLHGLRVRFLDAVDHLGSALTRTVEQVPFWLGSRFLMNMLRARWFQGFRDMFDFPTSVFPASEDPEPSIEDSDPSCSDPASFGDCGDFTDHPAGGAALLATFVASIPALWPYRVLLLRRLSGLRGVFRFM